MMVVMAVALSGVAAGIAHAVSELLVILAIIAAVVIGVIVAGVTVFLVIRFRRDRQVPARPRRPRLIAPPVVYERVDGQVRQPAIDGQIPQVVNNFFGVTPEQVAAILREQDGR